MFNFNNEEMFVFKYITYFQSLIYFRIEHLTRVEFSRHILTGFFGPTSDGKWSHHKISSILSTEILKLYFEDSESLASSSGLLGVSWRAICGSIPGSMIYPRSPFHHLDFMKKFWKSEKKCKIWILWFSEFRKIRKFHQFELFELFTKIS